MFRTVPLTIIRSLFTVHSAMVYVIQVCRQLSSRTRMELQFHPAVPSWSCSKAAYKPVWHIPLLSVQCINCWWWTEELSETCRVSCLNKFVKLVHLVGFIIKRQWWLFTVYRYYWTHFIYLVHKRYLYSVQFPELKRALHSGKWGTLIVYLFINCCLDCQFISKFVCSVPCCLYSLDIQWVRLGWNHPLHNCQWDQFRNSLVRMKLNLVTIAASLG